jgi:hypothetical protein
MSNVKDEADNQLQNLIDGQKKQARKDDHRNDQTGRDQRLAAGRPGDLASFLTDFLNELQRIGHCRSTPKLQEFFARPRQTQATIAANTASVAQAKKIRARSQKATRHIKPI